MRLTPLAAAAVLAFVTGVATAAPSDPLALSPDKALADGARAIYIVRFAEPALAAFRGPAVNDAKLAGLAATSPSATGAARLDTKSAASRAYLGKLAQLRDGRLAQAAATFGRPLEPMFVYDVAFNGVALELTAKEAATLAGLDGIAGIERDRLHTPQTDRGPRWINADAVWTAPAPEGNRGEGVVIGVIDSGINRTHPSFSGTGSDGHVHANPLGRLLGLCAGNASLCNTKLVGIHDFTVCTGTHAGTECDDDEANDGADNTGHGTHVASTAAGNTLTFGLDFGSGTPTQTTISGVAPHANLVMYKGCEREETCRGTWMVAAVNQAVADGVDVINYSIGGDARNPWQDSIALAMLGARDAGITVVAAAGNDGPLPGSHTSAGNAPWVIGVANTTHDRGIVNRVTDLAGGATPPPGQGTLVGMGATAGVGPAPIVYAGNYGSPLCATGNRVDDEPPSTATNPWPTPVFNGQIVVCDRGTYARTIKGLNVKNAGGAGMILANGPAEGNGLVADEHELPATHITHDDGVALKQWLSTGTGHTGRITAGVVQSVPSNADILALGSGRGPVQPFGTMKPNVSAPGTSILAAGRTGTTVAFSSGTSMASPHVAGAAALLRGAHPTWGPSDIETALVTTARPSVLMPDGLTPAGIFDQGAGVVDVGAALHAGLSLPVDRAAFVAAAQNAQQRSPISLNLPALIDPACFVSCTFTRTLKAHEGGTWRAAGSIDGATLAFSPAEFTLAAGATQVVSITVTPMLETLNRTLEGAVRFEKQGGAARITRLPAAIGVSPGTAPTSVAIGTPGESGFRDIAIDGLVALPHARFGGTDLVAPTRATLSLRQDPTPDNPYDNLIPNDAGSRFLLLPIERAGPARVIATTSSATAPDIDLFVGYDADGDNLPEASEVLCSSKSATATERCIAHVVHAEVGDKVWVLPQNWRSADSTAPPLTHDMQLTAAAVSLVAVDEELVATGPGHTDARDAFTIRAAWDVPDLLPGETRYGYVLAGTGTSPGDAAQILVELTRAATPVASAHVLRPGETRAMALAAGTAQDRLYLDVPPNASSLTVTTAGSGEVDLYVARATTPSSPGIDAAPARTAAAGTSIHPGAAETLTLSGAALAPGRWYVTPVNPGTTAAQFTLKADLAYDEARAQPRFGPYFNPARSGAGLFLFPAGDAWGLAWYTYLQDGSPTWYLGVLNAPTASDGVWTVDLQRQTWDGAVSTGTDVGDGQLAFTSPTAFTFSWNLDGESGSEPMGFVDAGGCPTLNGAPAAVSGLWFSPSASGYGYSINAYPGLESNGAYFYDDLGLPRWAIGTRTPFEGGERSMVLMQQRGFCPLCTWAAPTSTEIGTLTRTFTDASNGHIEVNLELVAPVSGTWSVDLPVIRASNALACP